MGMTDGTIGVITRGDRRVGNFSPCFEGSAVTALTVIHVKDATAEEGPVYKVLAAGTNGNMKLMDAELNALEGFPEGFNLYNDKSPFPTLQPMGAVRGIKSISVDKDARKVVAGTTGGEIFEMELATCTDVNNGKGPLITGHFRDQLHAMDTHPIRQECATAGDDKTLRVWDLVKKEVITTLELPDVARTVAYSPNGQIIVVGLGGVVVRNDRRSVRQDEDKIKSSKVVVVSFLQNKLQSVYETADASDAITCATFSADGSQVFVGSRDTNVYQYDPLNDFQLVEVYKDHTSPITSIELDQKCTRMLSVSEGAQSLLWDISTKKFAIISGDNLAKECADLSAHRRQTPYWADSLGVHTGSSALGDRVNCLAKSSNSKILVTGERGGAVKLFSYPAACPNAAFRGYTGHSSGGIASVAFTKDNQRLVTVGQDDKSMFVWNVVKSKSKSINPYFSAGASAKSGADLAASVSDVYRGVAEAAELSTAAFPVPAAPPAEGEEASTVEASVPAPAVPGPSVVLERLLGGSTVGGGPSAAYAPGGSVVMTTGSAVATLDVDSGNQVTWASASSSPFGFTAISISADRRFAVLGKRFSNDSGAIASSLDKDAVTSPVSIYNTTTGASVADLASVAGVTAASFSACGKWAAVVSKGSNGFYSLGIYNSPSGTWTDASCAASSLVDSKPVTQVAFLSSATEQGVAAPMLITGGESTARFWSLRGKNVLYETVDASVDSEMTCAVTKFSGGAVTGHADGSLRFWVGKEASLVVPGAHTGAVTALRFTTSSKLISGSVDAVKVWTEPTSAETTGIACVSEFDIEFIATSVKRTLSSPFGVNPSITAIDSDEKMERLLLCLSSNTIIELTVDSGKGSVLSEGHAGAIVSVATHPKDPNTVVTVGADYLVKVWDLSPPTGPVVLETQVLVHAPTCCEFKPDGYELAVSVEGSDTNGNFAAILIMKYDEKIRSAVAGGDSTYSCLSTEIKIHNVGVGKVSFIKYSSDGKLISAISEDKKVYVYSIVTGFKLIGYLAEHVADISSFDYSASCKFMRTFSGVTIDGIAAGSSVPTIRCFDLSEPTRALAGTECTKGDVSEEFSSASSILTSEREGLLT
jgi:WD40 repeat protein